MSRIGCGYRHGHSVLQCFFLFADISHLRAPSGGARIREVRVWTPTPMMALLGPNLNAFECDGSCLDTETKGFKLFSVPMVLVFIVPSKATALHRAQGTLNRLNYLVLMYN